MPIGNHVKGGLTVGATPLSTHNSHVTDFNDHSARHQTGGADEMTSDLPHERQTFSVNNTISTPNRIIACTNSNIDLTIATACLGVGNWLLIKDESGGAGGIGQATNIDTEGAETIDGAATVVLDVDFEAVLLYSNGTNWFIAGRFGGVV